eukprot:1134896-Alexandrium_andersonii.AAC.1
MCIRDSQERDVLGDAPTADVRIAGAPPAFGDRARLPRLPRLRGFLGPGCLRQLRGQSCAGDVAPAP